MRHNNDNWEQLQAFIDAHQSVRLPEGTFPLSRTIVLRNNSQELIGYGPENTTLKQYGDFNGPVIGIGQHGTWNPLGIRPSGVKVIGMTLLQTGNASGQNCLSWNGDDSLCENVRVRGSAYEGISAGSNNMIFRNVEAWDCGNGGPAYPLSTAGLNIFATNSVVDGFRCLRCGQGIETGHTSITWKNGVIASPGDGSPSIGINIGSTATGIYDVLVENVSVNDYPSGIQMGPNGIGRLAKVRVRNCTVYCSTLGAGAVSFAGGKPDNTVTGGDNPYEGPDTEGSEVSGCKFYFTRPSNGGVIYNSVPNSDGVYGREPLIVSNNEFHYSLADPSQQIGASVGFGGRITADCRVSGNVVYGLPVPSRGDINSVSITGNQAVQGFPNLSVYDNYAFGADGKKRNISVQIEGR